MELHDSVIKDKYYDKKRELKRLLKELQTADDLIQVSNISRAIDGVICDLVRYKIGDINYYRDERARRDRFYMKASLIEPNREYIAMDIDAVKDLLSKAESEEPDGKKA